MAQFDMAVNSGMEEPWQQWGKHWTELCEPLVYDQRAMDDWGTSVQAQAGLMALMALMPDAGHAPTDQPAPEAGTAV